MKNAIVAILNLRSAEKQNKCVQHQSALGNKALIMAFLMHEHTLGILPNTRAIVAAMNKSQPMVAKYLRDLMNDGIIDRHADSADGRGVVWGIIGIGEHLI